MNDLARSMAGDRRFYGVAEALVEDNNDPDGEGRVRLRFPWLSESMVTEWTRVAQPYAGGGYGAYFVPEKGDEVLVAFVHGDMRLPVVLGGLYNGVDKPAEARKVDDPAGPKDPKYLRSRTGHRIRFEDAEGHEKIEIIDASGNNSVTIDTVANSIAVHAQGDVTVEAGGKLTLKGATGVEVKGATIDLN